jgi:hypothetical protein
MFALFIVLKHLLPDTALATFTYILLSYHLVLAFKVFTGDKEAALSLPLWQTIVTHAAVLGLLVGLGIGRHAIPFFSIIRYFLPGLAPFEAEWLFSGGKPKIENLTDDAAIMAATVHIEPSAAGAFSLHEQHRGRVQRVSGADAPGQAAIPQAGDFGFARV